MKPVGVSKLNPYAAAYIPLARREVVDIKGSGYGSGGGYAVQGAKGHLSARGGGSFCGSSSSQGAIEAAEKNASVGVADEEFEMNLDFLRMTYPGMSDESLTDVLMANRCDLEAAMDMLNQLEFDALESPGSLPDSLDIGDISEPASSAESSSVKLKNVTGETSATTGTSATDTVVVS